LATGGTNINYKRYMLLCKNPQPL